MLQENIKSVLIVKENVERRCTIINSIKQKTSKIFGAAHLQDKRQITSTNSDARNGGRNS